jgi:predicted RNA polymerase sigma factor
VVGAIYLLYYEGYPVTAGSAWMRPALCDEALRLGRILRALAPLQSEVHGLRPLLSSSRLAWRLASLRMARRSCCWITIVRDGIRCTSCAA